MSLQEYQQLIQTYFEWLRKNISMEEIGDACEITTPFLDNHNDRIQIYIKRSPQGFMLTDDGYTMTNLRLSGCELTPARQSIVSVILNSFGIQLINEELQVNVTKTDFAKKKHNFLQAILSITDMFVLAEPSTTQIFKEDVARFLKTNEIRFTPDITLKGRSGFDHRFDFVIPESRQSPERLVRTINTPDKKNAFLFMFSWDDIKVIRPQNARAYAVLNDIDRNMRPSVLEAFKRYDIIPMPWSQRENYKEELAA